MRFRRSIKIFPGVKLNFGKSGLTSLSVGGRGASVSLGKGGAFLNLGLPGTGLSHRMRLDSGKPVPKAATPKAVAQTPKLPRDILGSNAMYLPPLAAPAGKPVPLTPTLPGSAAFGSGRPGPPPAPSKPSVAYGRPPAAEGSSPSGLEATVFGQGAAPMVPEGPEVPEVPAAPLARQASRESASPVYLAPAWPAAASVAPAPEDLSAAKVSVSAPPRPSSSFSVAPAATAPLKPSVASVSPAASISPAASAFSAVMPLPAASAIPAAAAARATGFPPTAVAPPLEPFVSPFPAALPLPQGNGAAGELLKREAERLNQAYDGMVNQHRKIRLPPADPADAYERFMPPRPGFRIYPLVTAGLALFAMLAVPATLHPLAVFFPALLALGISVWLGLSDASRISRWRRAARRAEELRDSAISGHYTAVETVLAGVLSEIDWVLETSASFEASPDGSGISVDVNLPEIEDLEKCTLVARNAVAGLVMVPKKQWVVQREYQLQVHAILLRIAGEIFFHFPTVRHVVASGWTDRADPATGRIRSEYIISAVFDRELWAAINPAAADPVECVGLFPVRRDIGDDSCMSPVDPFRPDWKGGTPAAQPEGLAVPA
ncbi:MAG: DUF4236 domain-containing protein [Deltaproteobacteria bacterium]|nr:DUF4236 domain-containing protein [Deltaproteobacteria bacterium]